MLCRNQKITDVIYLGLVVSASTIVNIKLDVPRLEYDVSMHVEEIFDIIFFKIQSIILC